jgi:hypothetical protein
MSRALLFMADSLHDGPYIVDETERYLYAMTGGQKSEQVRNKA